MPKGVKKAVSDAIEQAEHYPDVQCEKLRRALEREEQVPYEQIICGNGAADLIFGLVLSKKPKRALIPAPTFAEYQQALESVECEVCYAYLDEKDGFLPGNEFLERITEDFDMVFFCNPNNPTGVLVNQNYLIKLAEKSMEDCGIIPKIQPIRGGTDGARLSYMGLPCPNLGTGDHNCHGHFEFVCVQSMEKCVEVIVELGKRYAEFEL